MDLSEKGRRIVIVLSKEVVPGVMSSASRKCSIQQAGEVEVVEAATKTLARIQMPAVIVFAVLGRSAGNRRFVVVVLLNLIQSVPDTIRLKQLDYLLHSLTLLLLPPPPLPPLVCAVEGIEVVVIVVWMKYVWSQCRGNSFVLKDKSPFLLSSREVPAVIPR